MTILIIFLPINTHALTPQFECQKVNTYNNIYIGLSDNYWEGLSDYYLDYYADSQYYNTIKPMTT